MKVKVKAKVKAKAKVKVKVKSGMVMSSPRLKLTLRFCVVLFDLGTTFSSLHCTAWGAGQPRRGAAKRQARDTCGTV